jgi:hypothetical protein
MFGFQHKKEVVGVLDCFLSFLKKYEKKKVQYMFFFMLDPRFKTLCLVFSLIGREQRNAIIEKYDTKSLFLIFLSVIIICILWLNLKGVLLIKELKRTTIWISLR